MPPHTYTNLVYIEVLTAFEDAISPVTLKIFDKHLFPFTVNTAFLSSHAHMHARTHTRTNKQPPTNSVPSHFFISTPVL